MHDRDRPHQRLDRRLEPVVALVAAAQVGLLDLVHRRLGDPVPGIGD
jgi:hypothetical protein